MRTGYVDEAYDDRVYILACVIGNDAQDDEARHQLRTLLLGKQRQLHFAKEGPKRRALLAQAVDQMALPTVVVVRPSPESNERRRGQCLVALAWAVAGLAEELAFEARQRRLNERDHGVLHGIATHGPCLPSRFLPAEVEEYLWAADIVAGAMFADLGRGVRTYRALLSGLTVVET